MLTLLSNSLFSQVKLLPASISAEIVTPIGISKNADMYFEGSNNATAASFTMNSDAANVYSISLPATFSIDDAFGTSMSVGCFTSSSKSKSTATGNAHILEIGATLFSGSVRSSDHNSTSAAFDITVNYD